MNKIEKVLVVSCDYLISLNQEIRSNVVVILWFHNHIPNENGYMYEDGYIPIKPYFVIKKNIYGFQDESTHIPIELLSDFLKNPAGKLEWK